MFYAHISADIVRFGLRHRNLENIVLHSGAKWDQEIGAFFPRAFLVPYHVMDRQAEKDLCVSFKWLDACYYTVNTKYTTIKLLFV